MDNKLNVDIPGAISDFEAAAKEFELREKIYRIIYRGKGLEFDSYQDYTPDNDASNIDWRASKRAGKLVVKRYKEERDLEFIFVIDVGANMIFGSSEKLKCEYSAELISAMAHLIVTSNDKFGYVLFNDRIKEYHPPKGGINHFYKFADLLSSANTYGGGSNINGAVKFTLDVNKNSVHSVLFFSDFLSMNASIIKELYLISHKYETIAFMVKDPLDLSLPKINKELIIEDPNSGQQLLINPKRVGKIYEKYSMEQERIVDEIFKRSHIDSLKLKTDEPFVFFLVKFLKERVKKRGVFI